MVKIMENPMNKWMIWGNIHMVLGHIPKWMDGLFHGKIPIKMDDLGGKPTIFGSTPILTLTGLCLEPTPRS